LDHKFESTIQPSRLFGFLY